MKRIAKVLYVTSLTVLLVLVLFGQIVSLSTHVLKFQQRGSLPTQSGCLLIGNHPHIPVDTVMYHLWIKQLQLDTPVHFLIAFPLSYLHDLLTFYVSGTKIKSLPARKRGNTTQKIVDVLNRGEHVMAFLTPQNQGTGLAHALKETRAPCFAILMDKNNTQKISIRPIQYDCSASAEELTQHIHDIINPKS